MRYESETAKLFYKITRTSAHWYPPCIAVNHLQLFVTTRHVASRTANSSSNGSAMANPKVHANINGTLPKMIIIPRLCGAHFRQEISHISWIARRNLFRKTLRRKITRANPLSPLERSLDHQNISLRSVLFPSKYTYIHTHTDIHARAYTRYFDYISELKIGVLHKA